MNAPAETRCQSEIVTVASTPGLISVDDRPVEATDPGIPLADYRALGAGVVLTCLDCLKRREFPLEVVISRLVARGMGGGSTGIKAVAGFVRDPCPRCGGRRFDIAPAFPVIRKADGWTAPGSDPWAPAL